MNTYWLKKLRRQANRYYHLKRADKKLELYYIVESVKCPYNCFGVPRYFYLIRGMSGKIARSDGFVLPNNIVYYTKWQGEKELESKKRYYMLQMVERIRYIQKEIKKGNIKDMKKLFGNLSLYR